MSVASGGTSLSMRYINIQQTMENICELAPGSKIKLYVWDNNEIPHRIIDEIKRIIKCEATLDKEDSKLIIIHI